MLSFVHTFQPTILNEFRAGLHPEQHREYVGNPGVPQVGVGNILDDGTTGFGSYNGYPQSFKENIYTYSDMVSISHGNHNMKIGVDFRRNIENSEFNVARPSYYFYDQVFFARRAVLPGGGCRSWHLQGRRACSRFNQSPQAPAVEQLPALAQPGNGRFLPG